MNEAGPPQAAVPESAAASASSLAPAYAARLGIWLELTCRGISGTLASIVVTTGKEAGSFELVAAWPNQPRALHLVPLSENCLASRATAVQDKNNAVTVATPLMEDGRINGALVVEVGAGELSVSEIRTVVAIASRYLNQIMLGHANDSEETSGAYLQTRKQLLQLVCRPDVFSKTALETVNCLNTQFDCVRVALGMVRHRGVQLHALSHSAWFDRKSQAVTAIENAMEEALDQRSSVVLPAPVGGKTVIAIAHREAAKGASVCSVVLAGGDGLGAGVVYLERTSAQPFSAAEVKALEDVGELLGPVLESKYAADRWVGARAVGAQRALLDRLRDPRRPALRVGLVIAALALAAVTLLDTTWRISAQAAIEGEQQRVIPAPFEGFIASASVKAGLVVKKGQPLAQLDTRQIRLDFQRWSAEESQHDSRYRDALTKHDRPAAAISMAQMQQAQAQRALAEDKLAKAELTAPFDAFVVSGDLSQHIGSPVEQGKVLFELAPLDSYRVILKVDERDIRAVAVGQSGSLVLSGLTEERLPFKVKNISVPEASDGRNVFRVEAQLEQSRLALRPGMQGVAKIDAGQRSLLWIWTHPAWNWLALQIWKWSP